MEFTDVLKNLRSNRGESQGELAEELGVKQSLISQWESGTRTPSIRNLKKLGAHFHISLDALSGKEYVPLPEKSKKEVEAEEIAAKLVQLSNKDRSIIKDLVDSVIEKNTAIKIYMDSSIESKQAFVPKKALTPKTVELQSIIDELIVLFPTMSQREQSAIYNIMRAHKDNKFAIEKLEAEYKQKTDAFLRKNKKRDSALAKCKKQQEP